MPEVPKEKSRLAQSAIEQAILRACMHPALQHPMRYSIDYSRSLLLFILLSLVLLATWSTYIGNPIHALAPQTAALSVQLAGH